MTKVYLATSGEYSDYRVQHVFARREDAEAYELATGVEEYELQGGPVEVRVWHILWWNAEQPDAERDGSRLGNPWELTDSRDFDGNPRRAAHDWGRRFGERVLRVQGWDRERVLKVYSEQRAQYIARQQGVSD